MRISVLIPSYNSARYLAQTLASVAKQKHQDCEVIIADGGSEDGTDRIVDCFADLVTEFISEPDDGQLDGLQKAAKLATGEICYWLNADDIVMPGTFRYVSEMYSRFPKTEILFADNYAFSAEQRRCSVGASIRNMTFEDHFLFYRQMYSECVFWRNELTAKALPVDTSLRVFTDYSFFLPLRHNSRCRWVPKRLGAFRVAPGQMSQLHREKGATEQELIKHRMRQKLGISDDEFMQKRKRHYASFLLRQRLRPKFESGVRKTFRLLTGDRSRRNFRDDFFDKWLQLPDDIERSLRDVF